MSDKDTGEEMVLVPRLPTKEMVEAAWAYAHDEDAVGVWRAMIDAWLKNKGTSLIIKD